MQEEQMKILDMIASGKITAQEGASLLEALNSGRSSRREAPWDWFWGAHREWSEHHHHHHQPSNPGEEPENRGRVLRFKVLDTQSDKALINISLPIGLLKWREKMGKLSHKFKNTFFDVENLEEDMVGKIAEAIDENLSKKIEVWVE